MEKLNCKFGVLLLLVFFSKAFSQDKNIIRAGLLKSELTLSPSTMFSGKQSNFYLHGSLEGFVSQKISLSGEGYYYLGTIGSGESTFSYNHSLFFGASRHFTRGNSDFYIGIQPGVAITKLNENTNNLVESHTGVNPLASTVIGYNFFATRYFHFFVQTRFIAGEHNYDVHKDLSEFRFSAGLGFNLNTIKG